MGNGSYVLMTAVKGARYSVKGAPFHIILSMKGAPSLR